VNAREIRCLGMSGLVRVVHHRERSSLRGRAVELWGARFLSRLISRALICSMSERDEREGCVDPSYPQVGRVMVDGFHGLNKAR
jgi:hypothetical protein